MRSGAAVRHEIDYKKNAFLSVAGRVRARVTVVGRGILKRARGRAPAV
jgi:hypothetical protein